MWNQLQQLSHSIAILVSKHIWICMINCCLPNYSSSLLESLNSFPDKTRFSSLEPYSLNEVSASLLTASNTNTPSSPSSLSTSDVQQAAPRATSTPKSSKTKSHSSKPICQPKECLTILNINCRSIRKKILDLHQVIDQTKPDISACSETWLKPVISSSEILEIAA